MFMKNWHDTVGVLQGDCPFDDDRNFAEMVARKLKIPFEFVDLSDEYRKRVVDYMFDEYEKGARLAAVYNIFAFASLVPLLYIVPRMFASLHPGATGNPAFGSQDLDNTMRMVFYPAILGWTLLGFWIADLRIRYQRVYDKATGLED